MSTLQFGSLAQSLGEIPPENIIFGHSEPMQAVRSQLAKVAAANVPVLIHGESGTGKDIIARMIHGLSPWKSGPLVKVNCPAIPGTLLESELFGYEKGAFTGAFGAKLESEIEGGTFRQDLYYRINVVNLRMPSLRERRGDIEELASYFLEFYNRKYNCRARPLSNEVMSVLQKYHWPGNIRELENLIKRYVILGQEEVITNDLVAREPDFFNPEISFDGPISLKKLTRQAVRELERKVILKVLQQHHWNRKQAARTLSISYRALLYKIRDAGLPSNRSLRMRQAENAKASAGTTAAAD